MIIKKDMILRKVGNDIILVPVGNALKDHNGFFMLTESACFLWNNLIECNSVEDLAKKLKSNPEDLIFEIIRKKDGLKHINNYVSKNSYYKN